MSFLSQWCYTPDVQASCAFALTPIIIDESPCPVEVSL